MRRPSWGAPWARQADSASRALSASSPPRPSRLDTRVLAALVALALSLWAVWHSGLLDPDTVVFNPRGLVQLRRFLAAALAPELSPAFLKITARAALITFAYAVSGTALSLVLGSIGALVSSEVFWRVRLAGRGETGPLLGARESGGRWRVPWLLTRGGLSLPRAIHEVIWGLIFINILGLDSMTAVLAIGIPFGAIVAKVNSEILDETPRAPMAALLAAGATPGKAVLYGLLPLALPDLVSYAFYRFECSIRAAAVLGIVGAGGLGSELLLSTKSLKTAEMWTLIFALALLSAITDFWSAAVRRRLARGPGAGTLREAILGDGGPGSPSDGGTGARHGSQIAEDARFPHGLRRDTAGARNHGRRKYDPILVGSTLLVLVLVPLCAWIIRLNPGVLLEPRALERAGDLLRQAWPPRLAPGTLTELAALSADTLAMSVIAMLVAGSLGLVLAYPAANNWLLPGGLLGFSGDSRTGWLIGVPLWIGSRSLMLICRAVPPPIWALIAIWILFPGILPGALALGAYTAGILGRLLAELVEGLDPRPVRALRAHGASAGQAAAYGVLPLTLPRYAAFGLYRWEICVRTTVVVGLVGAGGLGQRLRHEIASFDYRGLTLSLAAFVCLTLVVDLMSARLRRALR